MEIYKDIAGNSAITGYEVGPDFIKIQFKDVGKIYKYSYRSASEKHVEKMKTLASSGKGLGDYVATCVHKKMDRQPQSLFKKILNRFRK